MEPKDYGYCEYCLCGGAYHRAGCPNEDAPKPLVERDWDKEWDEWPN